MKLKRKLLLCFFMSAFMNFSFAQNLNYGFSLNLGVSKVPSILVTISSSFKTEHALSGNTGLFLEKRINSKSSLGLELLWVQAEGKETSTRDLFTPSMTTGWITSEDRIHISYIGLPIYYRIQFGKIGIKAGVQPLVFLFASSNFHGFGELNNVPFSDSGEMKDIELDSFNVGPKIGIDFSLFENVMLRADYYHGLSEIDVKQITLGINFRIVSKDKADTN